MIQSLRGMNDLFDQDSKSLAFFIKTATKIAQYYDFSFISTPILEESILFKRGVGESSDIIGKEMYQFIDKGNNDVCLRPEGTAGIVRAFIQKKLDKHASEHRYFYYGPMFRYERPQKGRLRQFHQFGVESFGNSSVLEDAAIILMLGDIFNALQISFNLIINSLGCITCMPPFKENLIKFLTARQADICLDCNRRLKLNPIRVLDCKNAKCQIQYIKAPKLIDNLCKECDFDFTKLKEILNKANMSYKVDSNLVRGLDYYSKSAFEFISDGIGAQNAIAGGGRYDKLVELLGGKPTPAVGFAIGIERVISLLTLPKQKQDGYYFGCLDQKSLGTLFLLAQKKRKATKVHISYKKRAFQKHLNSALKINARFCVIIGEEECLKKEVWVKDLKTQVQQTLSQEIFLQE